MKYIFASSLSPKHPRIDSAQMFPFSIRYASIADGFYFADFSTWFTHNSHHQNRPEPDPVYGKILVLVIPGLVLGPGSCIDSSSE